MRPIDLAKVQAAIRKAFAELEGKTITMSDSVSQIKKFCSILQAAGIHEVTGDYDGSGDSGDMTLSFSMEKVVKRGVGHGIAHVADTQRERLNENAAKIKLTTGDKPLATAAAFDAFLDSMFRLLPGGWEINDGSYGEVHLDVDSQKITVEHNERYTDVNSSTHTY